MRSLFQADGTILQWGRLVIEAETPVGVRVNTGALRSFNGAAS